MNFKIFTHCFGITLSTLFTTNVVMADTYNVYCANEKIEVDDRSLDQMKAARGSDTCLLSSFSYLGDATHFADKNFHGVGAECSCR